MNETIQPEYLRLVPPLHESSIDELVWLMPDDDDDDNNNSNKHNRSLLTWDSSICIIHSIHEEIRQLMDRAYQGTLNLQQQQKLIDELDTHPDFIEHIGLSPSNLHLLVEHSPSISIQCLLKLISTDRMNEYLLTFIDMEMSLHSIEVINRLSTSIVLPQEFLQRYISTCIQTCEKTKDKYLQNRFVRLVSVFIQSLIRNKVIDIKALFMEMRDFALQFRRIKEATALFQLLQTHASHSNELDENILSACNDT
jgi:hypothetical protein